MSWDPDARLAAVEGNLLGLFRALSGNPVFDVHPERDVMWLTSESDCPIFNGALAARFPPKAASSRANSVIDQLVDHGRPFYWWLTPTTRSRELVRTLTERGLAPLEQTPGMYTRLDTNPHLPELVAPRGSAEFSVGVASSARDPDRVVDMMLEGFGMPSGWRTTLGAAIGTGPAGAPPGTVNVLARYQSREVGAGSLVTMDGVAGLYNIAVLPEVRNLGIGRTVTLLTLMNPSAAFVRCSYRRRLAWATPSSVWRCRTRIARCDCWRNSIASHWTTCCARRSPGAT